MSLFHWCFANYLLVKPWFIHKLNIGQKLTDMARKEPMRNVYSANNVLIRFIKNSKQSLDNHKHIDLPKPILHQFTKNFLSRKAARHA